MKKNLLCIGIISLVLFAGCLGPQQRDLITQTSTIDSLLAGLYDGDMTCRTLLKSGNFGIGTFDHLDGEMIVLNGHVYQVRADGKVYSPPLNLTTPFASVCFFSPDESIPLDRDLNFRALRQVLDSHLPNKNLFCAVKVTGTFALMHTRSVPAQEKPYLPLAQVTRNQPEFKMRNISGTIVGFRSPPYVKGIGVPGYHLHFISDDFRSGGHILGFEMAEGRAELDICSRFTLVLPEKGDALGKVDLSRDRSEELERVEK